MKMNDLINSVISDAEKEQYKRQFELDNPNGHSMSVNVGGYGNLIFKDNAAFEQFQRDPQSMTFSQGPGGRRYVEPKVVDFNNRSQNFQLPENQNFNAQFGPAMQSPTNINSNAQFGPYTPSSGNTLLPNSSNVNTNTISGPYTPNSGGQKFTETSASDFNNRSQNFQLPQNASSNVVSGPYTPPVGGQTYEFGPYTPSPNGQTYEFGPYMPNNKSGLSQIDQIKALIKQGQSMGGGILPYLRSK